jgi:potassium-transporting ATPase potassium-binding subunit
VLLPLSTLFALLVISQGAIQNLGRTGLLPCLINPPYCCNTPHADSPDGTGRVADCIALPPCGDGGGFFNANSAHPYVNPTPLSNVLQMLAIRLIAAALCHTFGRAVGGSASRLGKFCLPWPLRLC